MCCGECPRPSTLGVRFGRCRYARSDHCRGVRNILFICSRNRLRSPTAEAVFSGHPGVETDSAGLADDAEVPLCADQIEWADVILVMEPIHKTRLNRRFKTRLGGKKVAVLGIPDNYGYMDESLVRLLKSKCAPYLP
jgi:predicted protein tyrosine phosphatase